MATLSSRLEERTISEVRRLGRSGLEAPQLLQRVAHALQRSVPFSMYAGATTDPASNLITHALAGRADKTSSETRPVKPGWFQDFYFEETYGKTLEMIERGRLATTLARETGGSLELSLCYRESMRPAGIAHKAHTLFYDRNLWGDMELYRATGDPEFSTREIDLLQRLAPDIGAGLKFAALRARAATPEPDATTPGVLIFDAHGRVTSTPSTEALLGDLGDLHPGGAREHTCRQQCRSCCVRLANPWLVSRASRPGCACAGAAAVGWRSMRPAPRPPMYGRKSGR